MKIKYLPCQPHCFAFGGFDLQMIHTLEAVKNTGIEADKLNPWERDNNFDIIHLWGLDSSNYRTAYFAKKEQKKIVLTALTGYVKGKLDNFKVELLNKLQITNYNLELVKLIDSFVVLNEGQAEAACQFYKVPEKIISIIPAIVNDNFFSNNGRDNYFKKYYGIQNFVLTTGNVGQRKNQLNLAKACVKIGKPLVIIGNLASGEFEYGNELKKIVDKHENIYWLTEIDNDSPILISAYQECILFALISNNEQQPISPIEAAVLGKPIILADKTYAKQDYFNNSLLTNPNSIDEISESLLKTISNPEMFKINIEKLNIFKSTSVGEKYKILYYNLFQ